MSAGLLYACGGDDDDDASGSKSGGLSVASCNAHCEAQESVRSMGCEPFVPLADCKQICSLLSKSDKCAAQYNAFWDCSVADGFMCAGSLVTNKTQACDAKVDALQSCMSGGSGAAGSGATCKGADSSGHCPQIACPCPEGTKMVNGNESGPGGCECLTPTTCQDLWCD
jgi:hypothetical protein